jgi:hypothetical protein
MYSEPSGLDNYTLLEALITALRQLGDPQTLSPLFDLQTELTKKKVVALNYQLRGRLNSAVHYLKEFGYRWILQTLARVFPLQNPENFRLREKLTLL